MRARWALLAAGVRVELREVVLRNKPAALLAVSPKATVPVLDLGAAGVIEQSLEIMYWALAQQDPQQWLLGVDAALIACLDGAFKQALDRYKYPDRFADSCPKAARAEGEVFLHVLEQRLAQQRFLTGDQFRFTDAAVMPFVRQFAAVDAEWFAEAPYQCLQQWLAQGLASPAFAAVMTAYAPWHPDAAPVYFPPLADG
jgi:glutathione S-transferase